jgi:hypothetical protein
MNELLNIIKNGSRVLDIGCYDSSVVEILMNKKNCIGDGGEKGIRTLDTVARIHAFQACAFNHSATSPLF